MMQSLSDQSQIDAWRSYMKDYQAARRQGPAATEVPHLHTHKEIKTKEYAFDTVLAQFRDTRLEADAKEKEAIPINFKRKAVQEFLNTKDQGFDIITLEEHKQDLPPYEERLKKKRILPKAQVVYNIVTNNEHPEHHWKGTLRPEPKKEYVKKLNMDVFRDYNIISNKYWEGHETKDACDKEAIRKNLDEKYQKSHDFNYLTCSYFDQEKEEKYLREREQLQKEHGKDYLNRLPPTLKARETIVFDSTKEVPEEVKRFDLKKKNQKKRYEKRHELEQEYRDQDIELQNRTEQMALNRFNGQKFYEEKAKGYDNITLNPTNEQIKLLETHAKVKPQLSLWDKIQHEAIDRVPDTSGLAEGKPTENMVSKVVDIDNMPLYSRTNDDHQDQPSNSLKVSPGLYEAPEKRSEVDQPVDRYPGENFQSFESKPVFESMQQPAKSIDRQRLYDPELERQANLYRQSDADRKSNHGYDAAPQGGNQNYSRMSSGVSNRSRLSFASEGLRSRMSSSSNKLPVIGRQNEAVNPYNPQPSCKNGSQRSAVSQKSSSVKKSNLVESGAFY